MQGYKGKKRRYTSYENDDEFETEAFADMNEGKSGKNKDESGDSDSEPNLDDESSDEGDDIQRLHAASDNSEDSEDEAPDDVGFSESRHAVLAQLRSAMKQVDSDKQKRKEQRKRLDAQFKEQKAKKEANLKKAQLPEEFLAELEDAIPKKAPKLNKKQSNKKVSEQKTEEKDASDNEIADELLEDSEESIMKEDFISFTDSESGVEVARLDKVEKASRSIAQVAADFRQKRLYGSHIPRISNKERLNKAAKKRYVKKS